MSCIGTTTWTILTEIKDLLNAETGNSGTLSQIQQIKRGMLAPLAPFPQIAIIPEREEYTSLRSGRRAVISKAVEIIIYWRDLRGRRAIRDMESTVSAVVNILEANRKLLDDSGDAQTYNAIIGSVVFAEEEVNESVFHTASIPVEYIVKENLPNPTLTSASINDPSLRGSIEQIYDNLRNDSVLSASIREFSDVGFGPFNRFPALILESEIEFSSPTFTGIDQISQSAICNLLSPVLKAADKELQAHLTLVERIKTVLWTDLNLSGRASQRLTNITHGSTITDRNTLYLTKMPIALSAGAKVTQQ